ncbi:MAG: phosphoserine phosphatase RsbU/P, partial [Solirubrobacteraceae bacterium]|nr:phosphoserine phosphatase RsbU/P [Solirubrobacteraceae bacterium]
GRRDLAGRMMAPRSQRSPEVLWLASGLLAGIAILGTGALLHLLVAWPAHAVGSIVLAGLALAAGVVCGRLRYTRGAGEQALRTVVVVGGLAVLILTCYVIIVIGLGRNPHGAERDVLALSMVAALVAVAFAEPVRNRLRELADRWIGASAQPAEIALETFGARMTRAVPIDELLLQLAETLRDSIAAGGAEIWTVVDGALELSVSVPDRPQPRIVLEAHGREVLAHTRVGGSTWIGVWIPALLTDRETSQIRVAPIAHLGELLGLIVVSRGAQEPYDEEDDRVLAELARQVGLALHNVALDSAIEKSAAELEVARLIQLNFLPKQLPDLPGWEVAAVYRPARVVGGDFYDVIPLPDGRIGFVVGDVTDKGVPAALVMSATRSVLRASAQRLIEPGEVLERVNDHLCPDMPEKMFVTCLYGVLDPVSGRLRFANAGHDVPYVKTAHGVLELRARGMPLGLLPGMQYEEKETVLEPGDSVLLHSDGIAEAHSPDRDMFGFPRLKDTVAVAPVGQAMIDYVLAEIEAFVGPDAEQEDDITMVTLVRVVATDVAAP